MRKEFAAALLLMGSMAMPAWAQGTASVSGELRSADGSVIGDVTVNAGPKGLLLRIEAEGVPPGWHGAHFHENATCADAADGFKASGAHAGHGEGVRHGLLDPQGPEAGDLPNVYAGRDGRVRAEIFTQMLPPEALRRGVALVLHSGADDHTSQPIGGAGARIACAELKGG